MLLYILSFLNKIFDWEMKKIKHSYIIKVNGLKSFKYYNIFKILFFIYLSMIYKQNNIFIFFIFCKFHKNILDNK